MILLFLNVEFSSLATVTEMFVYWLPSVPSYDASMHFGTPVGEVGIFFLLGKQMYLNFNEVQFMNL